MHYRNEHKCEPPQEPKKINPKRKATPKVKVKKQSSKMPKLIYVLPGPVTEKEAQVNFQRKFTRQYLTSD